MEEQMNPNGENLLMGGMATTQQKWLPSFLTPKLPDVEVDLFSTLLARYGVLRTLERHQARGLLS